MPWYRPDNSTERFWRYVSRTPTGCWLWTGYRNPQGYGRFRGRRLGNGTSEKILAHRFSYQLHKGAIPNGLVLDHLCRNTSCVNPDHLEAVAPFVNQARGLINQNVHRDRCYRGHSYTEKNTRFDPKTGQRVCRACQCIWQREARERRKLRAVPDTNLAEHNSQGK